MTDVKIKTSVINSVNVGGAKVNVSLNQEGITISMPYETDAIKLNKKTKCRVEWEWEDIITQLHEQWESYDKQVSTIIRKEKKQ